jgi:hypothetical protein
MDNLAYRNYNIGKPVTGTTGDFEKELYELVDKYKGVYIDTETFEPRIPKMNKLFTVVHYHIIDRDRSNATVRAYVNKVGTCCADVFVDGEWVDVVTFSCKEEMFKMIEQVSSLVSNVEYDNLEKETAHGK